MPDSLAGLTSIKLLNIGSSTLTLGGLLTALIIVGMFWFAARLASAGLQRLRTRSDKSAPSLYIVQKLVTYGLVIAGVFFALNTAGLNLSSFAVFAGALGVGVGLGLQGVVKEFVSGLVLIFDRVVNIGDYIELESGARGLVQEIGPRATRIRTNDNIDILLPNSKLVENQVINWTLHGQGRRIHVAFGVAYGSDKDKVREVVLKAAHEVPFTLPDEGARKTQVWLTSLGESALNFELVVWPNIEAVKRPAAMQAAYIWAIEDALRCAGIEMPFPQQDLRLRSLFGLEGEAARRALNVEPERPARKPKAPAPTPSSSSNDAAEDLMSGGGVDLESPPVETAPDMPPKPPRTAH
ncbi:MAG TPA: mechanosensitive ion channel domain-containing protein [Caulobacteraceae bacterium]|jgi:small-conductance mechanosensitive channel